MQEILYLAHRIPFPPNKGDKVRSFNEIKHLAKHYRVHLGAFIDDPADWEHTESLARYCAETYFAPLNAKISRLKSTRGLITGDALTVPYYAHAGMRAWVCGLLSRCDITAAVAYSSPMAQYVRAAKGLRRIADFVDVDSDKWRQYAGNKSWPLSWIYRREAYQLGRFERAIAAEFDATFFVTPHEADLMRSIAPESAARIHHICNGVDADYFSPDHEWPTPYLTDEQAIIFTGAMDYLPNIDAVEWFAEDIFPTIRDQHPKVSFCIVGARPARRLQRLSAMPGITVIGAVPDVRPYIAHAALAVAPLRIARGVQNKVLEAMAMAKAVVVSEQAAVGISAEPGREFIVASDAKRFAAAVSELLTSERRGAIGTAARHRVLANYSWSANLTRLDALLSDDDGLLQQNYRSTGLGTAGSHKATA